MIVFGQRTDRRLLLRSEADLIETVEAHGWRQSLQCLCNSPEKVRLILFDHATTSNDRLSGRRIISAQATPASARPPPIT